MVRSAAVSWLDDLEALWVPDDPIQPAGPLRTWLTQRYEIAQRTSADRIVEIGVRAGYSAFAMLSARPEAHFLGIDARTKPYAYMDFEAHAHRILAGFANVELVHADSQKIEMLEPADLIHIDGDHSLRGCTSDMELALRSGIRWALIDDTTFIPAVRQAVEQFAGRHGIEPEWLEDGVRGSALMRLS